MEERREMNGQRMMTREELEMRLPALNHIAEQRDAKFRLRYAEKTLNNGIERGYTLDAGTRVSVNVYQKLGIRAEAFDGNGIERIQIGIRIDCKVVSHAAVAT